MAVCFGSSDVHPTARWLGYPANQLLTWAALPGTVQDVAVLCCAESVCFQTVTQLLVQLSVSPGQACWTDR